ncbi:MAG: FemAB family XrtA/PEP-CTERM system-associated protein, partial [Thermodesulfobacteriota bacterium]|nr:FemAB family XrtA/PEP-CTERM system-associated protein [Thermodesulfobacteriota bacterium]
FEPGTDHFSNDKYTLYKTENQFSLRSDFMTEIRLYKDSDRGHWDDYVTRHARGTFFHLSNWKEVVEKTFGHKSYYLLAVKENSKLKTQDSKPAIHNNEPIKRNVKHETRIQQNETHNTISFYPVKSNSHLTGASNPNSPVNNIVGVFPIFSIKSFLFGCSMVSVPFATYGGILSDNEDIRQALYEEAVAITKKEGLDYLEIRNESSPLEDLPVKDLYHAFKKEIFEDNEENLKSIPRKTRRMVRQGMKKELNASFGSLELLDQFYGLFAFSYHGFGTPVFSRKYLKNLLEDCKDNCSILIISKDEKPLAGVLSFYFRDQVIPYYSGAYPDSRKYAANDYLYWVLMSNAADRGCRTFDFGRSKENTGPFHFKRHWGFEPRALPYQYYLNKTDELPNISPANPKYQRHIELWKKLPLWATKIIGPKIVKYIP